MVEDTSGGISQNIAVLASLVDAPQQYGQFREVVSEIVNGFNLNEL